MRAQPTHTFSFPLLLHYGLKFLRYSFLVGFSSGIFLSSNKTSFTSGHRGLYREHGALRFSASGA